MTTKRRSAILAWLRVIALIALIVLPGVACSDAPGVYDAGGRQYINGSDGLPREWSR